MYKPSSNKATALFRSNTFNLTRSTLSTNDSYPVYVSRYNSSGSLISTQNVYSSKTTSISLNSGDYLTISGMSADSTSSGPVTYTTQSVAVQITSEDSGGSSVKGKDTAYSPGTAQITASVSTATHQAKTYINASYDSSYFSNLYITSNGTKYTNKGSTVYYNPTVTTLSTNTSYRSD